MHAESGIIPRFLIWPKGLEFANRCGINLLPNPGLYWVGIHGCGNCIYDGKIYDSVVYLLLKLAQFWYFGHVSKSLVAKSTTAMNPNPYSQIIPEWKKGMAYKKERENVHDDDDDEVHK